MQQIKVLPQRIINQIAAGEVIERPSSVVKELVENAIDAGATEITVKIVDGGKNFISVADNGSGMNKDSLGLCIMSHATSKLSSENLFDIHTFGFRGEALPSIASVSRLSITTSDNEKSEAWQLRMEGQANLGTAPASRSRGTTIEVRDLFFATPARLKFLKSESYETERCRAIFNDLALANCGVSFRFIDSENEKAHYEKTEKLAKRIDDIFGESFSKNIFEIKGMRDNLSLHGYIGVPTFNKSASNQQYFFVNNRLVKDKMFVSALKSAYAGLIPHGRYPVAILHLDMPHADVDVNVHPAKTEVRFRDVERIRSFIVSELKRAIESYGSSRSTTNMMDRFYSSISNPLKPIPTGIISSNSPVPELRTTATALKKPKDENFERQTPKIADVFAFSSQKSPIFEAIKKEWPEKNTRIEPKPFELETAPETVNEKATENKTISLGNALFQVNNTYIIAESDNGIIIVDQHAAAERIMLEELKNNLKLNSQSLLIPENFTLTEAEIELLKNYNDLLLKLGVYLEYFDKNFVNVSAVPALLETSDTEPLINDIIDELSIFGDTYTLDKKIHSILSTISCHSSLRAGKKLSSQEMNYLLRKMELTTNIAQCCHGRPSYIILTFKDLNNFFERS